MKTVLRVGILASVLATWSAPDCWAQGQSVNPSAQRRVFRPAQPIPQSTVPSNAAIDDTNTAIVLSSPNAAPVVTPQDVRPAISPQDVGPAIAPQGRGLGIGQQGSGTAIGPQSIQPALGPQSAHRPTGNEQY